MHAQLPSKTIVLLGAGHTNAHILTRWRMEPIADARLICVSDFPIATYSGMLPGVLSQQLPVEAMKIDLVRLCRAVGAELILDEVVGLDRPRQRLEFAGRPPLRFDVLSVGIGSVPTGRSAAADDDRTLAIKPMQTFLPRLAHAIELAAGRSAPGDALRIAIVGGGVAGVEVALCLQQWLAKRRPDEPYELTVIDGGEKLAHGLSDPAQRILQREIDSRRIETLLGQRVTRINAGRIELDDGGEREFSLVLLATSAKPPPLLEALGLPRNERGFLLTDAALRCIDGDPVFAVGDCGSIQNEPLPKAGVYAVRQGPILWNNIQRTLRNQPLRQYRPQRSFLKLLCLGDGRAVASYRGLGFSGRLAWTWKKYIDGRFMRMHQDYEPTMMSASAKPEDAEMRCVGCGGKVGGRVLRRVLSQLDIPSSKLVESGLEAPDDAAVLRPSERPLTATVDFFAPPLDDMYLSGRIAALNALNDVYAMGGQPAVALASISLPRGADRDQEQLLLELLSGALVELRRAGATLAGGHTLEGPRTTIGFTVLGELKRPPLAKSALRQDDALILTKPLGSGVLLAAHMRAGCPADAFASLIDGMLQSSADAVRVAATFGVKAATDVTGFGLAGHLVEMLQASGCSASLNLETLPLLPGAEAQFRRGLESTMAPANRDLVEGYLDCEAGANDSWRRSALFDPQTSGGLLLAAQPADADGLVEALHDAGYPHATGIGKVEAGAGARLRCV